MLLISTSMFAQIAYSPSGEQGLYIRSEFSQYSNSILTLYPGYIFNNGLTINGIVGIPHFVGPMDPDVRYGQLPLNGETVFGENIAYRLLNQSINAFPFDITLNSSYRYSFWSRYSRINSFSHRFDLSITLSRLLKAAEKLTYIPSLNFKYNYHYSCMPDYLGYFGPTTYSMNYLSYSFGFAILLNKILLSWEIDNTTSMSFKDIFSDPLERSRLSIGIVIPKKES